ncbi:MAG: hypothetical protein D6758_02440 [Gammaproteobacteria bacterium]|nr:MAG: hypothetical protein D6758_02440 [Gammaproteobacteria bacterium]
MIKGNHLWAASVLLIIPVTGLAAPVEYSGFVRTEISDNIRQASREEDSDVLVSAGAQVTRTGERGRFNYDTRLSMSADHYVDESFADRLTGTGELNTRWRPDAWWDLGLGDVLTQERLDRSQADNPDNRTRRNVLTASLARNIAPQSAWPARLSLTHVRTDYSDPASRDSERNRIGFGVSHALNRLMQLSLDATTEQTDFDTDAENRRHELNLGLSRALSKGRIQASVGGVRLKSKDAIGASSTFSGASFNARISQVPHARYQWAVSLEHTLDDTSSDRLALSETDELLTLQDSTAVRVTRLLATSTANLGQAQTLSGRAGYSREVELDPRDTSERYSLGAGYAWVLNPRVSLGLDLDVERNVGLNGLDSTLSTASAWYRRNLSRHWSVMSRLTHRQRDHELSTNEWDENRVVVSLEWSGLGHD